jgi:hypothetical protein
MPNLENPKTVSWMAFRNLLVLWSAGLFFTLLNVRGEEMVLGTTGAFLIALMPILALTYFFGKQPPSSSLRALD